MKNQKSDVDWPEGFDRTPAEERKAYSGGFEVTRTRAIDDLLDELRTWGADEIKLETGAEHQKRNPNRPYANASTDDPSAVVYFSRNEQSYAVACDKWDNLRDNLRGIGKYIAHKRMLPKYGVTTAEAEFETAALPPGDEDAENGPADAYAAPPPEQSESPTDVLNVAPGAGDAVIRGAARSLKAENHPDNGGDAEEFKKVVEAEEELLSD